MIRGGRSSIHSKLARFYSSFKFLDWIFRSHSDIYKFWFGFGLDLYGFGLRYQLCKKNKYINIL